MLSVNRNIVFLGLFSALLLIPLASNSEAKLWDLLITANVDNEPLFSGDRPIVSGTIVDHASKPVHKATVNIKSGSMSIFTTTSQSGEFQAELGKLYRIPGNYVVNISATTLDGKTGITSIQFQIKGELSPTSVNQNKLSTPEAKKYLDASPEDFDKNPIGFMLYNYYQKLYQEYLEDEKITSELIQEQSYIDGQKEISNEMRLKAIEEYKPSMGIFSGPQYENYVNSLDDAVRDTVVEHLNFTKNLVEEAQEVRNEILENGGTVEEAQTAYLEKVTTNREMIENLGKNFTASPEFIEDDTPNPETIQVENEETSEESPIKVDVNGVNVEVEFKESIFFVNVNGEILEFVVNGTEITLVSNE